MRYPLRWVHFPITWLTSRLLVRLIGPKQGIIIVWDFDLNTTFKFLVKHYSRTQPNHNCSNLKLLIIGISSPWIYLYYQKVSTIKLSYPSKNHLQLREFLSFCLGWQSKRCHCRQIKILYFECYYWWCFSKDYPSNIFFQRYKG